MPVRLLSLRQIMPRPRKYTSSFRGPSALSSFSDSLFYSLVQTFGLSSALAAVLERRPAATADAREVRKDEGEISRKFQVDRGRVLVVGRG